MRNLAPSGGGGGGEGLLWYVQRSWRCTLVLATAVSYPHLGSMQGTGWLVVEGTDGGSSCRKHALISRRKGMEGSVADYPFSTSGQSPVRFVYFPQQTECAASPMPTYEHITVLMSLLQTGRRRRLQSRLLKTSNSFSLDLLSRDFS